VQERIAQYEVAWSLYVSSPALGVGLGHPIVWTRVDGSVASDFTADTPLILLAKLGTAGLIWLVVLVVVWVRFVRMLHHVAGPTLPGLALAGWGAILVTLAWTGFTVEDKGFSFALMLLLALALHEIERSAESGDARQVDRR
jgi:hypothetical protein